MWLRQAVVHVPESNVIVARTPFDLEVDRNTRHTKERGCGVLAVNMYHSA